MSTGRPDPRSAVSHALAAATPMLFAIGIVLGRGVHEHVPPVGLSFWRWSAASAILAPFVWRELRANRDILREHLGAMLLLGATLGIGGTLLLVAVNYTTAINAAVVNATAPAVTIAVAWLIAGVSIGSSRLVGLAIAFSGVAVMVARADWRVLAELRLNGGDLIMLAAVVSYSIYSVSLYRLPRSLRLPTSLFVITATASLVTAPAYLFETLLVRPTPLDLTTVSAVGVLTVFTTLLAMLMWNSATRALGAHRTAVYINLLPVYGAVLAILFLGERLHAYHLIGAALVAGGIVLVVQPGRR